MHEENEKVTKGQSKHKRLKIVLAVVGVVLIVAGIVAFQLLKGREEPLMSFHDNSTGLVFQHSASLTKQGISSKDEEDNVFLRMTEPKDAKTPLLITARYEKDLKAITSVTRQDLRSALNDSVDKSFPKRYPDYRLVERKEFEVAGKKASQVTFTYKGNNGETVKQRFLLLIKDDNTAIYLHAQGRESDFEELNTQYFDSIFSTASVN